MNNSTHYFKPKYSRMFSVKSAAMLITIGIVGSSAPAHAQDSSWKQNFAACAGNSPFIEGLLKKHQQDHRPLMRIGDMQAWAIKDRDGNPTIALTTNDGLTIIGDIIGPQGEDISAALLATVPNRENNLVTGAANGVITNASPVAPVTTQQSQQPSEPRMSTAVSNLPRSQPTTPETSSDTQDAPAQVAAVNSAPITATEEPNPEQQAGMNTIFEQATKERVWFSAATPKEGAPVVYMLADPECPHCQWTIDGMHSQIQSGDIDLRIIFAPITGVEGFKTSLSILHTDNVAQSFMSHMTSKTRGTAAVAQIDPNAADQAVVKGIVDNINWMRTNRMPGVPFFLYMTDNGARFAFSELPENILTEARPL